MTTSLHSYGRAWFEALAQGPAVGTTPRSLLQGAIPLGDERGALLAIVPDPHARFPRARNGETGLEEGWAFAETIREIIAADLDAPSRRPIVVLVDVPSQAYGYLEELAGIHQALAAAAHALGTARLAGHPVTALIVGKAISGAFLAIGLQANRIVSLEHDGVSVQVMSKQSAARITRRTVEEIDAHAAAVLATAYDGASFARLGAVDAVIPVSTPLQPTGVDVARTLSTLRTATADARAGGPSLATRLRSTGAEEQRAASIRVRQLVAAAWND